MERTMLAVLSPSFMRCLIILETSLLWDFRGDAFHSSLSIPCLERNDWFFCAQSIGSCHMLFDGRMGNMGVFSRGSRFERSAPCSVTASPLSRASMRGACWSSQSEAWWEMLSRLSNADKSLCIEFILTLRQCAVVFDLRRAISSAVLGHSAFSGYGNLIRSRIFSPQMSSPRFLSSDVECPRMKRTRRHRGEALYSLGAPFENARGTSGSGRPSTFLKRRSTCSGQRDRRHKA